MATLLLDGTLTAITPIAIILPASVDGRTPAGAPHKRMLRDGVVLETVYVPPSSLRGRLRHLLTSELMRLQNVADGRVFTPDDYIDTALGGVKDRRSEGEDDRRIDLKAIRDLRERNPVVSLFGSMVYKVGGRLMVGDMTPVDPIVPTNTGRSVRANPFVRNPAIIELLDASRFDEFVRLNDIRTKANRDEDEANRLQQTLGKKKRTGAAIEDVAASEAKIAELTAKAAAGFNQAGGAVNIQQLLDGYDVIPEGSVMTNRIRLVEGTDTESALLLLALELLAKRPLLGGHTAHGCGEVAGAWRVRLQEPHGLTECGILRIEPFAGLQLEAPSRWLSAAHERALNFANEVIRYDFRAA